MGPPLLASSIQIALSIFFFHISKSFRLPENCGNSLIAPVTSRLEIAEATFDTL